MNYIFLDLEWNQPFGKAEIVTRSVPLYGEIIRIGAVKLDEAMNETDRFQGCVIPKYYKKMNRCVGKVTGLSGASITYGQPFSKEYERFEKWCGDDCIILTWGSEDERILDSNLAIHKMDRAHPKFYDIQKIFAYKTMGTGKQYSLISAVEHLGLPAELKAHDALNDAVYCARVGVAMSFSEYIGGYEQMLREIEEYRSEKYFRTFMNVESVESAMKNKRIILCRCPVCRRIMKRSKWVFYNPTGVICCCECKNHGEYYSRLKMKKCADGTYAVTKKYTRMTEEYREFYNRNAAKESSGSVSQTDGKEITVQ